MCGGGSQPVEVPGTMAEPDEVPGTMAEPVEVRPGSPDRQNGTNQP